MGELGGDNDVVGPVTFAYKCGARVRVSKQAALRNQSQHFRKIWHYQSHRALDGLESDGILV